MNAISRYLVQEFLKLFLLCLASFVAIYTIVDFFERVDNFLEAKISLWIMARYMVLKIPLMVQQVLPAALLMGLTISICLMAKNRELIVLRAAGVSTLRLFLPLLLVSICLSLFLFFLDETVLPVTMHKTNYIYRIQVQKRPVNTLYRNERFWYRGKNVIYHIVLYDAASQTLRGVTLYRFGKPFGLKERIDARQARWVNGRWLFEEGIRQELAPDHTLRTERFHTFTLSLEEKPSDFSYIVRSPEEMTYGELKRYIQKVRKEGYDAGAYQVDLMAKAAYPLVCVIMAFIGFPMALLGRGGSALALAVGMSIGSAFLYWVLFSFSISLGHSGRLPPLGAAWLANLIFLTAGSVLFVRLE